MTAWFWLLGILVRMGDTWMSSELAALTAFSSTKIRTSFVSTTWALISYILYEYHWSNSRIFWGSKWDQRSWGKVLAAIELFVVPVTSERKLWLLEFAGIFS